MEVIEHSLHKTILWLHENWGSFNEECLTTTPGTTENPQPGQTTLGDKTTTAGGRPNTSNINYTTAASVLLGMHIFTLIVWVHFKI